MKIPIVDENDNIIEYRERDNRDLNAIYRVSSLWITDTDGNILLARRAFNKSHDPGKWGPAVAGTVEEGETYEQNIIKEAEEEIGLKDIKPIVGIKKRRNAKWNYFVQYFLLTLPVGFNNFKIQEDEVAEIKWFPEEKLRKELKENPDEFRKGIHERMNESIKHVIIFSHGFGTRKDDRGLFTDIAEGFPGTESILFDYNSVDETENTLTACLLSEQARMLNDVIEKAYIDNPEATIDIIGHSQGCLAVSLAKPQGIHRTIFVAPSLDTDIEHTIEMFKERAGTEINLSGISRLARKDGTVTLVPALFWVERKQSDPISLYNELSNKTDLIIINAKQDEIFGHTNTQGLDKKIEIINIDGNHQFSGESRQVLIDKIKILLE
ncbi:MAG: NUDIX domain-containing protein [Candidatus Pacebacteria bacterium]|nr:NUDIX domain-containing protein [Candidatus Paceibacterota bacterium]MCF7862458.1 NUDIX domain-containing protein [Candidatus Paceibacterota bacterium]